MEKFEWKSDGKIFKGVGIYHLTFRVASDKLRLGTINGKSKEEIAAAVGQITKAEGSEGKSYIRVGDVTDIENTGARDVSNPAYVEICKSLARVELTPFGKAIDNDLRHFSEKHPEVLICARKIMDTHIHIVVWVQEDYGKSIKQIAHGFRMGITRIAKDMHVWPLKHSQASRRQVVGMKVESCHGSESAGLVLEQAFIRTLSRKGQLRTMIVYVILNAYRKWIKQLYPHLFVLHRNTEAENLTFRSLGNQWLLDWPIKQMVECKRKTTQEDWDKQLDDVMAAATSGAVTYTAAMNEGERYIAEKIRTAGYPLVKLMKDGFPPVGSREESKYKPGGVFNDACGQGKLLLLEAYPECYADKRIVEMTEVSLKRKAQERHLAYKILPHDSMRWKSIAGNEMMRLLCDRGGVRDTHL